MTKDERKAHRKFLASLEKKPCEICGCPPCPEPHHIFTIGAYGQRRADVEENVIWLCFNHHVEAHNGRNTFAAKYHLEKRFLKAFEAVTRTARKEER